MKLLVSDLDGTLYPKNNNEKEYKRLFSMNKGAIHRWLEAGNKFAVATARGIAHADEICDELNLDIDFIGSNGAEVVYANQETSLKSISINYFFAINQYLADNEINATTFAVADGNWYWNAIGKYPARAGEKLFDVMDIPEPSDFDENLTVPKVSVLVARESRDQLVEVFKIKFKDLLSITTSDVDKIDLGPLNTSKGISILELAKHYHIDKEDIITAGDSENDIAMFEVSKTSYCIDHADESVKKHATNIVASLYEAIEIELSK